MIIRAAEIGEYIYCRRAWWLGRVRGYRSANVRELAAGTAAHAGHGRRVWLGASLRVAAALLLALAAIIFLASMLPKF